jgi:hypothetical protein
MREGLQRCDLCARKKTNTLKAIVGALRRDYFGQRSVRHASCNSHAPTAPAKRPAALSGDAKSEMVTTARSNVGQAASLPFPCNSVLTFFFPRPPSRPPIPSVCPQSSFSPRPCVGEGPGVRGPYSVFPSFLLFPAPRAPRPAPRIRPSERPAHRSRLARPNHSRLTCQTRAAISPG